MTTDFAGYLASAVVVATFTTNGYAAAAGCRHLQQYRVHLIRSVGRPSARTGAPPSPVAFERCAAVPTGYAM
jgi:hypothetical protein